MLREAGKTVDLVCLALPVLMGRSGQARRLMRELEGARKVEFALSRSRRGIDNELWYLATTPLGELLIAYIECADYARAARLLARSRDAFDLWLKAGLRDATGVDLDSGSDIGRPELLAGAHGSPAEPANENSSPVAGSKTGFYRSRDRERGKDDLALGRRGIPDHHTTTHRGET